MKHYCNRRVPKQMQAQSPDKEIQNEEIYPKIQDNNQKQNDEITLPPGCDYTMLYEANIPIPENNIPTLEAQGGAYNQGGGYAKENNTSIFYDNMHGCFDLISVPKSHIGLSGRTVSDFIKKYMGKFICLDLWTSDCQKEELCGVLTDSGNDYLVINCCDTDNLTLVDLRSVRYINIYQR